MKRNAFLKLRNWICVLAALCVCAAGFACAEAQAGAEGYELRQMLVLSRHNIRSPLSGSGSVLSEMTNHEWFDWSSAASELSLRGGELETQMGHFFRKYLVRMGLMEENCIPEAGSVRIYANSMQRTIATANYFACGMFPIANVDVEYHEGLGTMDPVFFPRLIFTGEKYADAVRKQLDARVNLRDLQDNFDLLETVLDYGESQRAQTLAHLNAEDMELVMKLNEEPNMTGSLKIANSAADALKLQYYEESDDLKAAFGHALTREDWEKICEITEVYGEILFGMPLIAVNVAHPLLEEMYGELTNDARVFTFLCGHDSNIASVLSALDAKPYSLPDTLEKKTPIGSKVVFERWKNLEDGRDYVSVTFVYQSLEQLRERSMLDLDNPPIRYNVELNGLEPNADGMYLFEDVLNRFEKSIAEYDHLIAEYGE